MGRGKVSLHANYWFLNSAPHKVSSRYFTCVRWLSSRSKAKCKQTWQRTARGDFCGGWSNYFMDGAETPKKALKKSVDWANDCCRMCKCSFNVKYGTGKSGRMSTQNLYIASNCNGSRGMTAQLYVKFLLITQYEVPFINTSEATKRLSDRTENGKCTNVKNCRSHVG